jgi:hypothetical protein
MTHQAVYVCNTCKDDTRENLCCCAGCAATCHDGHDVNFLAYGRSYCDCGPCGQCQLVASSIEPAKSFLNLNKISNIAFDEDGSGRIVGTSSSGVAIPPFLSHEISGLDFPSLVQQCEALASVSKDTFWLGVNDTPRCQLEELARRVFLQHVPSSSSIDLNNSGVEWWVQVLRVAL